jgi:hypothetical protein
MANNRYINTNFWKDGYVIDLDPSEKLLFLYLLTNPRANIAGVYEISLREMAFDTGFDVEMVKKVMSRFERDDKAYFEVGYVVIKNFIKHQSVNPKIAIGIARQINALPPSLKKQVFGIEDDKRTNSGRLYLNLEALCIAYDSLSIDYELLNINTNTNLNTNSNTKTASPLVDKNGDKYRSGRANLARGMRG